MSTTEDNRSYTKVLSDLERVMQQLVDGVQELSKGVIPRDPNDPNGEQVVNICDVNDFERRLGEAKCRVVIEVVGRDGTNVCGWQPSSEELADAENKVGITADDVCDALAGRVTDLEEWRSNAEPKLANIPDGDTAIGMAAFSESMSEVGQQVRLRVNDAEQRGRDYTDTRMSDMAFPLAAFLVAWTVLSIVFWIIFGIVLNGSEDVQGAARSVVIFGAGTAFAGVIATVYTLVRGRGNGFHMPFAITRRTNATPVAPTPAPAGSGADGGQTPSPDPVSTAA